MKTLLTMTLVLLTSSFVNAQELPLLERAPQPLPINERLSYSEMKEMWKSGTPTTASYLEGTWRLVAWTASPSCPYLGDTDTITNMRGFQNDDGTIPQLDFSYYRVGNDSFSGRSPKRVFGVELRNYGADSRNQGPYRVDPNEPQFAQWPYASDAPSRTMSNAYFSYSCRAVRGTGDRLICSVTPVLLKPSSSAREDRICASSGEGAMKGFVRNSK